MLDVKFLWVFNFLYEEKGNVDCGIVEILIVGFLLTKHPE